jgi:DNA uptake protein ComE-like DNA-binding protein
LKFRVAALGCLSSLAVASALAQAPAQPMPPPSTPAQMPPVRPPAATDKKSAATKPVKKVDLNNASLEELKTLPTVGDAEAKAIIAHRPYKSKGELVTKAGLPEGVYHAVKHKVEMQTPRKAAPKK